MELKDKIVTWFIRNIILPRNEIIDKPGFIVLKFSKEKENVNLREILIPESIIANVEITISKNGKERNVLYSIGKIFGYTYSYYSVCPTANEKEFSEFSYNLVRFLEAVYASKITHTFDYQKKIFQMKMWDWIVCNKNGLGFILTEGAGAGMISYAFQDMNIEATQIKCQGRGDTNCHLICAPSEYFEENNIPCIKNRDISIKEIDFSTYNALNKIRMAKYAKNSLKSLFDAGFFKQKGGILTCFSERFVWIESSFMYILEKELAKHFTLIYILVI